MKVDCSRLVQCEILHLIARIASTPLLDKFVFPKFHFLISIFCIYDVCIFFVMVFVQCPPRDWFKVSSELKLYQFSNWLAIRCHLNWCGHLSALYSLVAKVLAN